MARPGAYVADVSEGITCVEDLPKAKIKQTVAYLQEAALPRLWSFVLS